MSALDEVAVRAAEPADPLDVKDELIWFIEDAIRHRPRSLQKMIGPSEIGHECGRWLGYKLADAPVFNDFAKSRDQWRTQVGTAVHTWLAEVFERANPADVPLFMVEQSLNVGSITPIGDGEPQDIYGSGDLWYRGIAVDWKIVGPSTLKKSKTISRATKMPHGPSQRYRKQINTYGKGWVAMGLPVHHVMIAMLPAAGELRADSYFWHDEFRPEVADQAMTRLNGTNKLIRSAMIEGRPAVERVLEMLPTADAFCTACPYYQPSAHGLAGGCPGDANRYQRADPLLSLIPTES